MAPLLRSVSVLAVIPFFACACSSEVVAPRASPSEAPREESTAVGERMTTVAGNSVTVHAVDWPAEKTTIEAPAGYLFVAADVEACAGADADVMTGVSALFFSVETDVRFYPPGPLVRHPDLHDAMLAPNGCARGWVTFLIPEKERLASVWFQGSSNIEWEVGA